MKWALNSEIVAKAQQVGINACLPIAINNMVGGVLYNSIMDFLEFQAYQTNDGVETHLLQFILQKGIKLKEDKVYFHAWDENA